MKAEEIKDILGSPQSAHRKWAVHFAGRLGSRGFELLPTLLELAAVRSTPAEESRLGVYDAIQSIGWILRDVYTEATGDASILKARADDYYERLLDLLVSAQGVHASLIIYALAVIGRSSSRAVSLIEQKVAENSAFPEMMYRAYQFACRAEPQLLKKTPWQNFVPSEPSLREEWNIFHMIAVRDSNIQPNQP